MVVVCRRPINIYVPISVCIIMRARDIKQPRVYSRPPVYLRSSRRTRALPEHPRRTWIRNNNIVRSPYRKRKKNLWNKNFLLVLDSAQNRGMYWVLSRCKLGFFLSVHIGSCSDAFESGVFPMRKFRRL